MQAPRHVFREYDIRGLVQRDLTPAFVRALGRGLGTEFRRAGASRVGVGRDVRPSGDRLFADLAEGLLACGCDVVDFGRVATPTFYHGVATGPEQAGVQITGSHNPPEYNGFKIVLHGESFFGGQIQAAAALIEREEFDRGQGHPSARDVTTPYLEDLSTRVQLARSPRFAYDSGNGAAALVAGRLFARMGLAPVALFDEPDGTFPNHHPDPTMPENLEDLREQVLQRKLECGIAYDGDADRIGVIDDQGQVLWGDRLLILYARQLLRQRPGAKVIFDVKCSQTLADDVQAHGGQPIIWKTGHSLIKQKMRETQAQMAGEMSGHMFFADRYLGFDDAIYATLRLLEIVAQSEVPLSRMLSDVPRTEATPELRVDCPDDVKFRVVEAVKAQFEGRHPLVDIDGVRVTFEQGWGLVRASNTQPALVVRVEAQSVALRDEYLARMQDAIATALRLPGGHG
jgi:phosphomannomutase/phosphoglucomutase